MINVTFARRVRLRDTLGVTGTAHTDAMKWMKRADVPGRLPVGRGSLDAQGTVDDGDDVELHVCSWCGRFLEGDVEDELNGDGPGADICGDCNRTKNWEAIEMYR